MPSRQSSLAPTLSREMCNTIITRSILYQISGHRISDSRRDVLPAAADAICLRASSGCDSPDSRGRFSPSELPGDRQCLAWYMARAGFMATTGQSGIVLLDHSHRLLRLPRSPQLQ